MSSPNEQIILVNSTGERIDTEAVVNSLRKDSKRVLADDEFGTVLYVGDLDLYSLKPLDSGDYLAQKVTELSSMRFPQRLLRKQIGSVVLSVTEDTVFLIKDGDVIKKVRADGLKKGMVLATGEKVFS